MIPEDNKKLISDTPRKKRDNPEPQTFEESVKPPELTIFTLDVMKLEKLSPLITWAFQSPPITVANWKKVQQQIQSILAYTQTLGYIPCFHPKDIQLLLEAVTKHFLWNMAIPFENKDLVLTTVLNECLQRAKISQLTEPHWVLKEWDDIVSFMLCGQHLVLPIIAGQFEDPPSASRPKGQERRNPPERQTRQRTAADVSTGSLTGNLPEDDIVEHSSDSGNANNGEHDDELSPPLGRGTIAGGGEGDGDDTSASSDDSSSG